MRKICPNCGEMISPNEMYCSGACRREVTERRRNRVPLTPEEQEEHDKLWGRVFLIVAIVVALWLVVGFVGMLLDILGCWVVICIVPALWFGFLFVRWFLKWLAKLV